MDETSTTTAPGPSRGRGRGSHKSRGGLGKYLRARGRGRGRGRGAVFTERLLFEGEQEAELDEDELKELQQKYSKRDLGTNADRYVEPEPELDSEGEAIVEPEVDLSAFLERQRLSESSGPLSSPRQPDEDDDIDHSLEQHTARPQALANTKKGKVQHIDWDTSLEELSREKANADATRELKERFRAATANQKARASAQGHKPIPSKKERDKHVRTVEAPALPTDPPKPEKSAKENMEDFLDDLLG
ncbi:hypothetical protein K474DRAFT_1674161 [Panus rudis PR-1116 ss-1]|nr:hypothetical protein K474DRAFT_1674161 [Panus rudis PR-1116 ss-1]